MSTVGQGTSDFRLEGGLSCLGWGLRSPRAFLLIFSSWTIIGQYQHQNNRNPTRASCWPLSTADSLYNQGNGPGLISVTSVYIMQMPGDVCITYKKKRWQHDRWEDVELTEAMWNSGWSFAGKLWEGCESCDTHQPNIISNSVDTLRAKEGMMAVAPFSGRTLSVRENFWLVMMQTVPTGAGPPHLKVCRTRLVLEGKAWPLKTWFDPEILLSNVTQESVGSLL